MLIYHPDGSLLGMDPAWLDNSPFKTYLIPGFILLIVVGLFPLFTFIGLLLRPDWHWANGLNIYSDRHWAWTYSLYSGIIAISWIAIQQIVTQFFWIQPIITLCGLLIIVFTLLPSVNKIYQDKLPLKKPLTINSRINSHNLAFYFLLLAAVCQGIILFTTNGTGDDGDSVLHFLFNRYAFNYPFFFVHLWAKPLLVTASCLFAQFGFFGMKIFNLLTALTAAYFTFRVAEQLKMKNAFLAIPFLIFMPMYFHLSFSGLTEPLFSLVIISALFLLFRKNYFWSVLLISFSPFARPEGMFFIGLFFLYLASSRPLWKYLPLLITGHVFYTLIGVLVFGDTWLWVFTKNPNAQLVPEYGQTGTPWHYIMGLRFVAGPPLLFLTGLGLIHMFIRFIRRQSTDTKKYLLILTGFLSVVVMHTIFWMYGLFKSFGLLRNMLTMAPLMAIIALDGFNLLWTYAAKSRKLQTALVGLVTLIICIYPFSGNKYSFSYPDDFNLDATQIMSYDVADYLEANFPDHLYYYEYPTLSLALGIDHFDWRIRQSLNPKIIDAEALPVLSVAIWDDWYAVQDRKVSLEMMQEQPLFEFHKEFTTRDKWNRERKMIIFTRRAVPE